MHTARKIAGIMVAAAAHLAHAQTPPPPTTPPTTPPATPPTDGAKPPVRSTEPPKVAPTPAPTSTPPAAEPAKGPEQPVEDPSKDEALRDASLKSVREGQQARPATPPAVAPSRPVPQPIAPTNAKGAPVVPPPVPGAIPGIPRDEAGQPARRFYPEGTFLSRRAGKVLKATTGDVVFVPARDPKGRGEAPMILLPSQTLARLEAAPGIFSPNSTVVLSGEVYVYYDRQYLLPTVYTVDRQGGDAGSPPPPAPTTPTTTPNTTPAAAPTNPPTNPAAAPAAPSGRTGVKSSEVADPAVADLIRELETKRGSAKAPDTINGQPQTPAKSATPEGGAGEGTKPGGDAGGGAGVGTPGGERGRTGAGAGVVGGGGVTTEGTVLFNKRARLVRVASGPLMAAFDGDTRSPSNAPMVLLRCRMVQRLDELAASRGDDLVLQVSGRVFVYAGRNYLLPTLAQVVPTGDVRSLQ